MTIAMAVIFGYAFVSLMRMVPFPPATWTSAEVAAFYAKNASSIRFGATLCSWTSAFMVPLAIVISVQMQRLENGRMGWSLVQIIGGVMMSLFLVMPPIFWGANAFRPDRLPDATAALHDVANLIFVTTTQYYIFQMIAIAAFCLRSWPAAPVGFPRWMGYFTLSSALVFEAGAISFLVKTGPFAWNGLLAFYLPFTVAAFWIPTLCWLMFRAIRDEERAQA